MDKKFVILCIFFLQNCYLSPVKSNFNSFNSKFEEKIYLFSDDIFLLVKACASFQEKNIQTYCNLNFNFPKKTKEELISKVYCPDNSCYMVNISSNLKEPSSDFFRNVGISLLTLSLGGVITNSAKVEYLVQIKNSNEKEITSFKHESFGRVGFGLVLPIYAGLISTIGGTSLNTYRRPDKLKQKCQYEIDTLKTVEDVELCTEDYLRFVQDSFQRNEKEFFEKFEKILKQSYENKI